MGVVYRVTQEWVDKVDRAKRNAKRDAIENSWPSFYVDGYGSYFVVKCRTIRDAKRVARQEYGPAGFKAVRLATEDEIATWEIVRGPLYPEWVES